VTDEHKSPDQPPATWTAPCERFYADYNELFAFLAFVGEVAHSRDEVARIASETLLDGETDPERRQELERVAKEGSGALVGYQRFRDFVLQLTVTRGADNYLLYIAELMALIFRTRPETLRSGEQVTYEDVLEHATIEELVATMTDRKVEDLSRQGLRRLTDWFDSRFGLTLFESKDDERRASILIGLRNLFVHNRGIVNRTFLKRLPNYPAKVGEIITLSVDGVFDDVGFLAQSVSDVDTRAASKFHLPTQASTRPDYSALFGAAPSRE
jgi:hypothetical protein